MLDLQKCDGRMKIALGALLQRLTRSIGSRRGDAVLDFVTNAVAGASIEL